MTETPKIKCVWCSADWSDTNVKLYNLDAGDQCASGRFYPESCSIKIVCHACHRLMYQKDGVDFGYDS